MFSAYNAKLRLQGAQVQSLVRELKPRMLHGQKKKKTGKKGKSFRHIMVMIVSLVKSVDVLILKPDVLTSNLYSVHWTHCPLTLRI